MATRPETPPPRGTSRARTVDFNGSSGMNSISSSATSSKQQANPMVRKLIVPAYGSATPISNSDGTRDSNNLHRTTSNASTHSLPNLPIRHLPPPQSSSVLSGTRATPEASSVSQQMKASHIANSGPNVLRKPAPPVPNKKPSLLSNSISPTSTPSPPPSQQARPQPPPPRRSMASRSPAPTNLIDGDGSEDAPPLPPRTGTGSSVQKARGVSPTRVNLLDDEPSEELEALKGWEVLRPVR